MRFPYLLSGLAILALASLPASAQGPAVPTAFDGKYVGTATLTHGGGSCSAITSAEMTVTGGQVVIREIHHTGGVYTYRGNVDAAGAVSAVYQSKALPRDVGQSDFTVSGTIHDKLFTGQRRHGVGKSACFYDMELTKG